MADFHISNANRLFAMVCASNMNRSMEAHFQLAKRGFKVRSFGTGDRVKLPGPSIDKPNVYQFGTEYQYIYNDLKKKDENLYIQNGLLTMLERNINTKKAPERWHDRKDTMFDVVLTFEERVYDAINENAQVTQQGARPVHIINIEVKDNHNEAALCAQQILSLVKEIEESEEWEEELEDLIENFENYSDRTTLHTVHYY
eukprot:GFYU01032431.1.p1 GENE.GFYU01032431.1~~GFYU01032431.1.p1  ORF type:complete len:200 (+),score=33.27 GFYU01032431.1:168-767(+)